MQGTSGTNGGYYPAFLKTMFGMIFLLAALISSAGYYCAPNFWDSSKRSIGGVSFLIGNFAGVYLKQEVKCVKTIF